jgi:hypothetical protein
VPAPASFPTVHRNHTATRTPSGLMRKGDFTVPERRENGGHVFRLAERSRVTRAGLQRSVERLLSLRAAEPIRLQDRLGPRPPVSGGGGVLAS